MREVKRDFPWFSITEYEKEAAYLRRRHKQIFHSSSGNFTIPKLLLEFIFPFSVTGYWFNNICLYQIGKKF